MTLKELIENPRAGLAASIAAGLLLLTLLGHALTQWTTDWQLAHKNTAAKVSTITNPNADKISKLSQEHLFGVNRRPEETTGLPITSLQLQVTGIIKAHSKKGGMVSKAIISVSGQPGKVYQVGDVLPGGVKIDTITKHAVILEHDGRLERLPLPGRDNNKTTDEN